MLRTVKYYNYIFLFQENRLRQLHGVYGKQLISLYQMKQESLNFWECVLDFGI